MEFVDTHCHVHFPDYGLDADEVVTTAIDQGVTRMLAVGCTLHDSKLGVEFASRHKSIWASVGVHPHEAKFYTENPKSLQELRDLSREQKVVAIGEIGLDYYYQHSSKEDQKSMLRYQVELGLEKNLPFIFHVREAFSDFFEIIDEYKGIRGVIHSFTADPEVLEECLSRGLYIGLNGIMTFTKDNKQLESAKLVPKDKLLLETDSPYLTPVPFRGTICQPVHVVSTAQFLAKLRQEDLKSLADYSTHNAIELFKL